MPRTFSGAWKKKHQSTRLALLVKIWSTLLRTHQIVIFISYLYIIFSYALYKCRPCLKAGKTNDGSLFWHRIAERSLVCFHCLQRVARFLSVSTFPPLTWVVEAEVQSLRASSCVRPCSGRTLCRRCRIQFFKLQTQQQHGWGGGILKRWIEWCVNVEGQRPFAQMQVLLVACEWLFRRISWSVKMSVMHKMLCSARNHAVPGEEVNTLSRLYRNVKAPQTGKQTHSHARLLGESWR